VTGDFDFCTRDALLQTIVNLGGTIKTSVSRKTDYLLSGTQDKTLVLEKNGYKSTKYIKAEEINRTAKKESDFVQIIEETELIEIFSQYKG
jgi:DNA polymerase-3 subunit epsilon